MTHLRPDGVIEGTLVGRPAQGEPKKERKRLAAKNACAFCGERHRRPTGRQEEFARQFVLHRQATKAARAAGYTDRFAANSPMDLLYRPAVQCLVAQLTRARRKRTQVTEDMLTTELWGLASLDPAELFDENGELLPIFKMPESVRKGISSVDVSVIKEQGYHGKVIGHQLKFRFWSKTAALQLLGDHLGYTKGGQAEALGDAEAILRARRRAARALPAEVQAKVDAIEAEREDDKMPDEPIDDDEEAEE